MTSFQGHAASMNAAVYSANQRYVITGGADQLVKIWNAKTGEEVRTLAGHTGQVLSVAVSADDRYLVSGAMDNTLRLWDLPRPEPLRSFAAGESPVRGLALSADGRLAVSVGDDMLGRVWRLEDGSLATPLEGHTAETIAAAFRGDNQQIATADIGGVIRLWGPLDALSQGVLGAHTGAVRGLAYHPNNQQLVSAGDDGQLKVWQLPVVKPRQFAGHTTPVTAVALNSDGQLAVTGGGDSVRVFNTASGAEVRELTGAVGPTQAVAVTANNTAVAAAGEAGVIKFWNLADGADRGAIAGHTGAIHDLAFHSANARIASAGDDGGIRIWRLPIAPSPLVGHTGDVASVAISKNGQVAVSASSDKTMRGWNPTTGAVLWQQPAGEQPPARLAIRPDSTSLAVGDAAGLVEFRGATDGQLQQTLGAHVGEVRGIAYAPGGDALATVGADDSLKVWKLPLSVPQVLAGNADAVTAVAITSDAARIVTGGADKSIRVFDAASGQQTATFAETPDAVTSLALSQDDALAAAGHAAGVIKVWNMADGTPWKGPKSETPAAPTDDSAIIPPAVLTGHAGAVTAVQFDAAAQRIASSGSDGTLRLWRLPEAPRVLSAEATGPTTRCVVSPDGRLAALAGMQNNRPAVFLRDLASGAILQTLLGHEATVTTIAFQQDGKQLVTGGADNTARVWNLADPKFPEVLRVVHPSAVSAAALSADGAQLYSAAGDNIIRCTNLADGSEVRQIKGHTGAIVRLLVQGATLYSGSADGTLRLWNTASGAAVRAVNHGAAVTGFAVDATGKTLATCGADKNVKLWNAADGAAIATLAGHVGAPLEVAFNADGARLASISDEALWMWDVAAGRRLESFALPEGKQHGVGFHQAQLVAAAADGSLRIVAPHLEQLIDAHAEGVLSLAFTPDGKRVVTSGADKTVKLWDLAEGKQLAVFAGPTDVVSSVAVTLDGKQLLAGGADAVLRAWPLPTAAQTAPVAVGAQWELAAPIRCLHLSQVGSRVAVGGEDHVVRVWDWAIGRELQRFTGHTMPVTSVALSRGGEFVVSGGADKSARKQTLDVAQVAVLEAAPNDVAFLGDATQLVTAGEQPALTRWQISESGLVAAGALPKVDAKPEGYVAAPQTALAVSNDASRIAALDASGRTHVWNVADGALAFAVEASQPAAETATPPAAANQPTGEAALPRGGLQFSAEGGKLVIGFGRRVRVVDAASGVFQERFDQPAVVTAVAVSPDGAVVQVGRVGEQDNAALYRCSLERIIASHDGAVTSIAFTPDGNQLVSGGDDKLVRRWNVADGAEVMQYTGSEDAVTCVEVTRDGQRVLAGGLDKTVRIWPLVPPAADAQPAGEASAKGPPSSITFTTPIRGLTSTSDSARIAVCGDDGVVRVVDLNTGGQLERFGGGEQPALAVTFAPDNRTLVSGGGDNLGHAWTMSLVRAIAVEEGVVHDLALANNGAQAVTAGKGGLNQWNLADGNLLRSFTATMPGMATTTQAGANPAEPTATEAAAPAEYLTVAVRGDNQQVAACDADMQLSLWNLANGERTMQFKLPAAANRLRYSLDNQKLVAACSDNRLRFFNPADGVLNYELKSETPLEGVAFTSDNRTVLTGGGQLRQWLYASPTAVRTMTGHGGSVYSVTFSPDSRWIASTSADQSARIWNVETGASLKTLTGHEGPVYCSSFSPDGALLVTAGADKSVRLWDVLGGRQLKQIPVGEETLYSVAFFPDGKRVAAAGLDRKIYLVDALTGKIDNTLEEHPDFLYRVTFNDAGTRLLSCGYGGNVIVWNAANGQPLFTKELGQVTNFAAFAPDGARIVVAGGDGKAYFVDVPANAK